MKIRVKDTVIVRTGKDRGQTGTVLKVDSQKNKVVVEGVNKRIKHVKGRDGNPGQKVEIFGSMDISNVGLIDPKSGKATRVRYHVDGKTKNRVAVASGETITGTARTKDSDTAPKTPAKKPTANSK